MVKFCIPANERFEYLPPMKSFTTLLLCLIVATTANSQDLHNHITQVDSLLGTLYTNNTPGISIAIFKKGLPPIHKSFGLADIATQQPITVESNFNIGSLTKQFTAMGILQLKQAGKLSLNDKLSRYFPDMASRVANTVTIRQLLTHSSGIFDHYAYTNTTNLPHAHNADVYAAIKNIDSTYFTPGTRFKYSNTGFCLLALIIEKASGQPYAEYLQKHIFTPAGMLHTTVWGEHANISNPVTGYDIDSATGKFTDSGPEGHPFFSTEGDGGIYTSIHDYIKWLEALQGGKIFPAAIVNEARSLHFTIDAAAHAGYGYGWFVDAGNLPIKVYHSGSNGGFRAYSYTVPSTGYMLVIFSNRSDIDLEVLVGKINRILFGKDGGFTPIEVLTN